MKHYIRPSSDVFVRYLLGSPKNGRVLLSFLNAVLVNKGFPTIKEARVTNPFNLKEMALDKESILDIKAVDENGRIYDIEVQVLDQPHFLARTLYYWAKNYTAQVNEAEPYKNLLPVICINLVDFAIFDNISDFHSVFLLLERDHPDTALIDHIEMHYLELPKFHVQNPGTALERWMYYFNKEGKEDNMLNFVIKDDPDLQFADSIYKSFTEDRESFDIALSREKYRRDMISRLDDAISKGEAKGKAEGKAEGMAEGKAEGEAIALRHTASNMKKLHLPLETVVAATGLSAEEIDKL